ncbi:MAG: hypothetical protein Q9167_004815 [Letrouitia subvulpina]
MIEARSLSRVLTLADNPPTQQSTSDFETLIPLILYIARVPGSRDVFLTTVKPLQNNVTAQDVQSCLYYVHLNSAEDANVEKNLTVSYEGQTDFNRNELSFPSPEAGNGCQQLLSLPKFRASPENSLLRSQLWTSVSQPLASTLHQPPLVKRKLLEDRIDSTYSESGSLSKPLSRHLIGPRALESSHASRNNTKSRKSFQKENVAPNQTEEMVSRIPARVNADERFERNNFLTLIRRYDGLQSNVGKISLLPSLNSTPKSSLKRSNDEVLIGITTPGYAKFSKPSLLDRTEYENAFECRLIDASQNTRARGYKDYGEALVGEKGSQSDQGASGQKVNIDPRGKPSKPKLQERKSSSAEQYTFNSPWDGHYAFSAGFTGRRLKCKYVPHSGNLQPLRVSELRFNLPNPQAVSQTSSRALLSLDLSKSAKRSSFDPPQFARKLSSPNAEAYRTGDSDLDSDDERLDLSLGQELSGGGFAGKQAKLGKLIIEHEGLKMLDLVVAANIGVWWKTYEKLA